MYEVDTKTMSNIIGACIDSKHYYTDLLEWAIKNKYNSLIDLYSERIGQAVALKDQLNNLEWK